MNKYWWEVVQAAEFVDETIIIERLKYQAYSISDALDHVFNENDNRNDGLVSAKILGVKITGLEM